MKHPLISIVIATLNSEHTLSLILDSIKRQDYPRNKLEVLVVDGGSSDMTLDISKKYDCRLINNPHVDQVFAKHMGYISAKGQFLIFLDSDEVLENNESIKLKYQTIKSNSRVKAVVSSGYKTPQSYPSINHYINDYGDPFSFFMYRSSRVSKWFIPELSRRYKTMYEDEDKVVFDFSSLKNPPFLELTSMGVMIDLKYVKKSLPQVLKSVPLHTHLFYLLNLKKNQFAFTKHDVVVHYSASSIWAYLKKIRSRIKSNIFGTSMGSAGYAGREDYYSTEHEIKKYLFVPYTLSIFLPLFDSVYLSFLKKNPIYLAHALLCLYTVFLIAFYVMLKFLRVNPKLHGYGT